VPLPAFFSQGSPQAAGDLEFSIEVQGGVDMVVVAEPRTKAAVGGDALVRYIHKFEEIVRDLDAIGATQKAAAAAAAPAGVAAH
jgi:hypothetical protein